MNSKPVFPSSCRFISTIKFNDSSALFCCHTIIISPIFADLALEAKLGNKANYILTDSLYVCIIYFFLLVFSSKWCFFCNQKLRKPAVPAILLFVIGRLLCIYNQPRGCVPRAIMTTQPGPALGSALCCRHLEILSTVGQRALQFHFPWDSANYTARKDCLPQEGKH